MNRITKGGIPVGNWDKAKYHSSNPLYKFIVNNFSNNIKKLIIKYRDDIGSITEVGCGEGYLTSIIKSLDIAPIKGCDFSSQVIKIAQEIHKDITFYVKDIYNINKKEKADLILCCEVLEHLNNPEITLERLNSVTNRYCLLSVPNEPIWRILNIIRGKYILNIGNTPGHIKHWSCKKFFNMVSNYMEIIEVKKPFPWVMLFCKKRLMP